ncbi:hypothetical protein [Roseiflexus castenholzii]|uniref:Uncharacterized protein n=1 Tax=Roseiflexus castenholzii (strain DSM 13941 / HLO8) TaxID=383372 RepID=A7NQ66_ROSCS|nr:hypothetical protein [Roseiflexus castenholzii]ABU59712.1 conserved hypothetical protein [Roseiflexus castenholzii DSM 13941]
MKSIDRPYDIDEIAPGRFVVRDTRANTLLKREGDLEGRLFTLRSWRRDGLLARLRERGFRVRTLEDRVRALPPLPPPVPAGVAFWHPLPDNERWSVFDPQRLDWVPVPEETRNGVVGCVVRQGQVIRRRRGRGVPRYALVAAGAMLRTINETEALLRGYAQAATPTLAARCDGARLVLPAHPLPPPHRSLIHSLAVDTADNCPVIMPDAWTLAQAIYARLGVRLVLSKSYTNDD